MDVDDSDVTSSDGEDPLRLSLELQVRPRTLTLAPCTSVLPEQRIHNDWRRITIGCSRGTLLPPRLPPPAAAPAVPLLPPCARLASCRFTAFRRCWS